MTDTATYRTVAKVSDLEPGELMYVEVGDEFVCLINMDGEIHAINDTCTHEDASLSTGVLKGEHVKCPLHNSRFDLRTGEALEEPAEEPLGTYPVREEGGRVLVGVPEEGSP